MIEMRMMISSELKIEIDNYCTANGIKDTNSFIVRLLKKGFTDEKYGGMTLKFQPTENSQVQYGPTKVSLDVESQINLTQTKTKKDLYEE